MPASDLILTPASVFATSATTSLAVGGEALNEGDIVYRDAADTKYKKADATTSAKAKVVGFVVSGCAAADQPIVVATVAKSPLTINAVATQNGIYVLSTTPGLMMLESDLLAGNFVTFIGIATTTSSILVNIWDTNYQIV